MSIGLPNTCGYLRAIVLALLSLTANALFADDAGNVDFLVVTAGHGVTKFVHSAEGGAAVLTSDTQDDEGNPTSCFVASRNVENGDLLWRRNVCSTRGDDQLHDVATWGDYMFTMDLTGIVRAWTMKEGDLIWDSPAISGENDRPRLWTFVSQDKPFVAASSSDDLVVFDAITGQMVDSLSANSALEHSNLKVHKGEESHWLSVLPDPSRNGATVALVAFVNADDFTTAGDRMVLLELDIRGRDVAIGQNHALRHVRSSLSAFSFQVVSMGKELHALALKSDGSSIVHFSLETPRLFRDLPASTWHPKWAGVKSIHPIKASGNNDMLHVTGDSAGLFRFDDVSSEWEQLYGLEESEETQFRAVAYCPEAELVAALQHKSFVVWRQDTISGSDLSDNEQGKLARHRRLSPLHPMTVIGEAVVPDGEVIESFTVLSCTADAMTTLLATASGTTTQVTFSVVDTGDGNDAVVHTKVSWTAEDGLAHVSSAVMLDATHLAVVDLAAEQDAVLQRLTLASRLESQWNSIASLFKSASFDSSTEVNRRDHVFGFVKIAALLSQSSHRLWGMSMSGKDRGSIRWTLDLSRNALRHTMVHGTVNAPKAVHGINGGTHSREILALSYFSSSVEWTCLDGTNGAIHAEGSEPISSPVVQILPIYGGTSACRQLSLLLHEDRTFSVIPSDSASIEVVRQQVTSTPNGFYAHVVDTTKSKLESFQVANAPADGLTIPFISRQVGQTSFSGEQIVSVTYPVRDEVVQSMCSVLGDDSLLLKYINPHMAVIVTILPPNDNGEFDTSELAVALAKKSQQGGNKKKRKPVGAGDSAAATAAGADPVKDVPNMFVNVVDTVSGRILHRRSHVNVDAVSKISTLITENWIIYSFVNKKTRRTELGVLTLHEGMIDSKGLTAFSSPEQTLSFSSFDARESKPVVLAKTYTYPKHVTALGSTSTRGGISNRLILIASADGKITGIERKLLETRRPTGEVKDAEKKEGLFRYMELIPEVPLMAISYNQTVESTQSIVSTYTSLESQSLVFAFGGPDLFFTRTSPSKGFDLLPDSFSRILVSIVVLGLICVLFVVKRMASDKAVQHAWL